VQIKCTAEWRPWPHPPIHPQMPMKSISKSSSL
jgi:hypothetical protein